MALPLTRRRAALGGAALCLGVCAPRLHAADTAPADAGVVVVEIREHRFVPARVEVRPGTTVRWVNAERRTSHSVLLQGPPPLESDRLMPGDTWSYRFDTLGRHPYRCGPHPEMTGEVLVQP